MHVIPGLDQLPVGQIVEPQVHGRLALGELVPVPAQPTEALREKHLPGGVGCEHAGLSDVGEVRRAQTAAGQRLQALQSVFLWGQIVRAALDLAPVGCHSCAPDGGQLAILQRRGARLCPAVELGAGFLRVAQTLEQLERKTGKCAVALPLRDLLQGCCAALCALALGVGKQVSQQQGPLNSESLRLRNAKHEPGRVCGVAVKIRECAAHVALQLFKLCPVGGGCDGEITMEPRYRVAAALGLHVVA